MRRTLVLAALLASGTTLLAAERATFIMTNGERVMGTLVARTYADANITRGTILLNANNRNMQVQLRDVAVVDFVGGQPSVRELDSVMRVGSQYGRYNQYD